MAATGTNTGTSGGITQQFQLYFVKQFLQHAKEKLVLQQFGQKKDLPQNTGSSQMAFMRPDRSDTNLKAAGFGGSSKVVKTGLGVYGGTVTEGNAMATWRDQSYTRIYCNLDQYMIGTRVTDVLQMTGLYDALESGKTVIGEDMGLSVDTICRDEIIKGTQTNGDGAIAAPNLRYAGGATTYTALRGLSAANATITIQDILDGATVLTAKRAPEISGGGYATVAGPAVWRDILSDPKVTLAGQYGTSKALFNGEVGSWYGNRVMLGTNPFITDGSASAETTYSDPGLAGAANTGSCYKTLMLGEGAFGVPILAGGSPFSPRLLVADKADKADPGNNITTAVLKVFWTAVSLNKTWAVSITSKSTLYAG